MRTFLWLMISLHFLLWAELGAQPTTGRDYYHRTISSLQSGEQDSAAIYWKLALDAYCQEDSLSRWVDCHKNLGRYYRDSLQQAEEGLQALLAGGEAHLWRPASTPEEWDALLWLYIHTGFTYNHKFEDYRKAVAFYEKAQQLFTRHLGEEDFYIVRYLYGPLANIYTRLGDTEAAAIYLRKSSDYFLAQERYEAAGRAMSDLGIAEYSAGNIEVAASIYREAQRYPGLSPETQALLLANQAMAMQALGQLDSALASVASSLAIIAPLATQRQEKHLLQWKASLLSIRAEIFVQQDALDKAEQALREAEAILLEVATVHQNRDLGKLYNALGGVYLRKGQYQQAINAHHQSLHVMIGAFEPLSWESLPGPEGLYAENTLMAALNGKAEALRAWYEEEKDIGMLKTALRCHELNFEVEQHLRRTYYYESSKLFNVEEARNRSAHAIDIALELLRETQEEQYKEAALAFAERSKSTLLLEAFYKSKAESLAGIPEEVLREEKRLQAEIARLEEEIFEARAADIPAGERQQLESELLGLRQSYASWIDEIEETYPRYFRLKYDKQAVTSAMVRQQLKGEGEGLVEYFVGQEKVYLFLITRERFEVIIVKKDFPLEDWVVQARAAIEQFQFSASNRDSLCRVYNDLAFQLYQKLFAPLEEEGLPERLTIIPSGVLGFLPFDALLTAPPPEGCNFSTYPYLLRRYNISYGYSAALQGALSNRPESNRRFAGFAPAFDGKTYGELTFSAGMLNAVQQITGGTLYLDTAATTSRLSAIAPDCGLIHLATHAEANTEAGDFSFVVFSDGHGGYDSLFVKDIYLLPLQAELAVLSACETSVGKLYQGEGIISLARAFLYAGANSVITTLWPINDEANNELMRLFYSYLKEGYDKSEALRLAKLDQLEDGGRLNAHPVYWAAFEPIGNMRPVYPAYRIGRWAVGLSGGLLLLLGILVYRRQRQ